MKNLVLIALFAVFGMIGQGVMNQASAADEIYTKRGNNLAVSGYDTVAYFTQNAAVEGSEEFTTEYKGAEWRFASQGNLEKFTADPDKYAPQYGGYCAWAAGHDNLYKGNPEYWHIENDKLYLNVNGSVQKKWLPRRAELIEKADANFPALIAE